MQDVATASGFIRGILSRSIAKQYLREVYGSNAQRLGEALADAYQHDLVLNSKHVQERISNLGLENEGTIIAYMAETNRLFLELEHCGRSASIRDYYDTLLRVLPEDWEARRYQI